MGVWLYAYEGCMKILQPGRKIGQEFYCTYCYYIALYDYLFGII
jgi:hypothetical protein